MIAGIVASGRRGAGAAPYGATIDFIAGTYEVGGTSYALADIFTDLTSGDITADRGLLVHFSNAIRPKAAGALATALAQAHTAIIEWEDLDFFGGGAVSYVKSSLFVSGVYNDGGFYYVNSGSGLQRSSDNYVYVGTNRLVWNIGVSDTNITWNGEAPPLADVDGTDFLDLAPFDDIYPFGESIDANTTVDGYVRRLTLIPPAASSLLQSTSVSSTPGLVGTLSTSAVGSTTVDLSFTDASAATSHEYWLGLGTSRPAYGADTWTALAGDKIITGLTPSTSYTVFVRGRNASGPGGCGYSNRALFTTTA